MSSSNSNGPQNGVQSRNLDLSQGKQISRPLSLQEALPYFPQTSTTPFIPGMASVLLRLSVIDSVYVDIIPDPAFGSGSPALPISDLFSTQEFDQLNAEANGQAQLPKNTKQAVDFVLQDLKLPQRTK